MLVPEKYLNKRVDKAAAYFAKKKDPQAEQFASINNDSNKNRIFEMVKKLKHVGKHGSK